jgi:hypothetical protein
MRARIKPIHTVSKRQKAAVNEYVQQELRVQQVGSTRRVFKLFCVALNEQYGFGKKRLSNVLGRVTAVCEEKKNDPVFWTHVDRVIEQIGLEFQKEDYKAIGE